MRWLVIFIPFLLGSSSCMLPDSFKYYSLYLEVQDNALLKEGDAILAKGAQVGRVNKVRLGEDKKYIVELLVNNEFMIPYGSELRIVTDIDNASAFLDIQVSHSKRNYSEQDTVKAFGTVLLNNDVILEEVEVHPDTMEIGIRHLLN
jgi:ABC-type transporter Mla subunit MlaD